MESRKQCDNRVRNEPEDAQLRSIIEAWPSLPPAIRAGIVAMVRAAHHERKDGC